MLGCAFSEYYQRKHEHPEHLNKIYSIVGPVFIAMVPHENLPYYENDGKMTFRKVGEDDRIKSMWEELGPQCYYSVKQDLRRM